jgi:hypothetical protein
MPDVFAYLLRRGPRKQSARVLDREDDPASESAYSTSAEDKSPEAWLQFRLPLVSVASQARRFGAFRMHLRYAGQVVASFDARSDFTGARREANPECLLSIVRALSPCSLEIPLCHSIPRPALLLFCCFRHGSRAALDMRDGSFTHHHLSTWSLSLIRSQRFGFPSPADNVYEWIETYRKRCWSLGNLGAGATKTAGGRCKKLWGWRLHDL